MLQGETANVKMWGAKGDGVTDDGPAIQAAVNACFPPWTSELLIPAGFYLVSNTIVFNAGVHIRGEGPYFTRVIMPIGLRKDIFRSNNANNALKGGLYETSNPVAVNSLGEPVDFDHELLFEGLTIQFDDLSNETASTNAGLVVCNPGEANTIRNVYTSGGGYGIRCLGAGTPGLRVMNVSTFYPTLAGICIEPLVMSNGTRVAYAAGTVSLMGIGGDSHGMTKPPTASLLRITNCNVIVSVYDFKSEGAFGAGIFDYRLADSGGFGSLTIHGGTVNAADIYGPVDLVVLKGDTNWGATANLNIEGGLNLNGVRYLIRDEVSPRNVDSEIYGGPWQTACRLPIHYQGMSYPDVTAGRVNASRLVRGQTAFSYVTATNTGWYRVMIEVGNHLAGNLKLIAYGRQSTELQIDVTPTGGTTGDGISINVVRAPYLVANAVVTQARAFSYWDTARSGWWCGVDINIGNPLSPTLSELEKRLTLALDIDGIQSPDAEVVQLLGSPVPVGTTLPGTYDQKTVNTYR